MKKLFITLFLVMILCTEAYASDWVKVDKYNYINLDSVSNYIDDNDKIQPNKKVCLMKRLNTDGYFKDIEKKVNKKIESDLSFVIFDFKTNKYTRKTQACFDAKGKVVYSVVYQNNKLIWKDMPSGSAPANWAYLVKNENILRKMQAAQKNPQIKNKK